MTAQPSDLYDVLRKLRYELTACQAKLSDAFRLLGELQLPEQPQARCAHCGLGFRGQQSLAEHVYQSHNGPLPAHWRRGDELVEREL